ncbi:MAG: hypothetical protein QOE70_1314 [Chthoniobacter sp.]|jgi:hypothetical protein|nr:hypothetical protein [Chthoniobacter sp.]
MPTSLFEKGSVKAKGDGRSFSNWVTALVRRDVETEAAA